MSGHVPIAAYKPSASGLRRAQGCSSEAEALLRERRASQEPHALVKPFGRLEKSCFLWETSVRHDWKGRGQVCY